MRQTPGSTWVFLLLALAGAARAAGPQLSGRYRSEGFGELEFTSRDGRVVARHLAGGRCGFAPGEEVVNGEFEGNVLVGTLALCQRGPACQARAYPVLAFLHPEDGSLTAHVKLESGCTSPALRSSLLLLSPVPGRADGQAEAPRSSLEPRAVERFRRAFVRASRALERAQWEVSARAFEEALQHDPHNWAAHLGLGVAAFQQGDTEAALQAYQHALRLEPAQPDTYYNLACVHARLGDRGRALTFLQQAVARGFDQAEAMAGDRDLRALLGEDLDFQRLLQQVRSRTRAAAAGPR